MESLSKTLIKALLSGGKSGHGSKRKRYTIIALRLSQLRQQAKIYIDSGFQIPDSGLNTIGIRNQESEVRSQESGIWNLESGMLPDIPVFSICKRKNHALYSRTDICDNHDLMRL
jgi:hypothetical protein